MASPSRALAPAGGLGIGEEDTGDCDQGVGDVFWGRGGNTRVPGYSGGRGAFNRLDPGCPEWACLGGQISSPWPGKQHGLWRWGGAVLREAGSSPPTFQGDEEADASPEVKGSPQAQAYTLLPVSRRF